MTSRKSRYAMLTQYTADFGVSKHFSRERLLSLQEKGRTFYDMGTVRIGTCSWKFPSWEGKLYSPGQEPEHYLSEYAQRFDMVEVDQWFWSLGRHSAGLPTRKTVLSYAQQTPADFKFTIKCPNALTRVFHDKEDSAQRPNAFFLDPALMTDFIASLEPIRSKIGLLMLQFGYLNKLSMENQSQFIRLLDRFFDTVGQALPFGIELRNPKWLNGEWFSWLQSRAIAPVLIQGYWMEDICRTIDRYEPLIGDTVSLRLHGEDREEMEAQTSGVWDTLVHPREHELSRIAASIKMLADRGRLVYVQVNNHYEGSALLTIGRLQQLLG